MSGEPRRPPVAPSNTTMAAALSIAVADLGYLALSFWGDQGPSATDVAGRLLLALLLVGIGLALVLGVDPQRVQRLGPLFGVTGSVAFALTVLGQRGDMRAGYLGFLPAVPLVYALLFPLERWGAAMSGVTLLASLPLLYAGAGFSARFVVENTAALVLATLTAVLGGLAVRRAMSREALALDALARSERERSRTERLVAVGRLAAGVAHDVNSPLGSLHTNIQFARDEVAAGRPASAAEALEDAAACSTRIQSLLSTLGGISRWRARLGLTDPSEATRSALRLGALRLPAGIDLEVDLADGLPMLPLEQEDLEGVLEQMLVIGGERLGRGPLRFRVRREEASVCFSLEHAAHAEEPRTRQAGHGIAMTLLEERARLLGCSASLRQDAGLARLVLEVPFATPTARA